MEERLFKKLGFKTSTLGLGCMRLPLEDDKYPEKIEKDASKIDEDQAIELIRYAIDKGITYIDTAYPYHGGNSEVVVGKALQGGYREKVKLATKLPVWLVNEYGDFERLLDEQLRKLQTDYVDFYLLHALNKNSWKKVKDLGVLDFIEDAIKKGKIRSRSFSFHDSIDTFKDIIDSFNWDMCQIQLNYMDENYQAGLEGLYYAASKGISVVIMEPLRGGRLVKNVPEEIQKIWDSAPVKRSPADWAFRWICNFPEVTAVLSGMGSKEEIDQNVATFNTAFPNSLTEEELEIINKVKEIYKSKLKVNCTECKYCIPCPQNVAIPNIFSNYNSIYLYNTLEESRKFYNNILGKNDASLCVECGLCQEACPQNIPIIESLKAAHKVLIGD
ncbi:hypothetical protein SAMN02745227_01719 [Anaerobranca californiensis DSM 14826]|jgi:predicted aldo/keto reductase-like oxidoreductase|uniref:4Fe-4S ferredoxin-type domain-containing protein n=1 Tax=Anaerobranca californiensis DSM 14826 TaxID=1120989 RepID=A0A1M6QE36_9FIRM|nr:aldo/keto reductase [Anaerobranca californiensis]SHK18323.1 hypothetical protein SAMN02745227_01719 [Anaerobranca californiensis DSM 14826]